LKGDSKEKKKQFHNKNNKKGIKKKRKEKKSTMTAVLIEIITLYVNNSIRTTHTRHSNVEGLEGGVVVIANDLAPVYQSRI
jgi:adenosyl cobinamide kinase/adenosyl cobinamide phosphate guanylyltransferase